MSLENDPLNVHSSVLIAAPSSGRVVPNENPTLSQPYRIAVIGDMPTRDDEVQGKPFQGPVGRMLSQVLQQAGAVRAACYLGNLSQTRLDRFDWNNPAVVSGMATIASELFKFRPNIVVLLGKEALNAAKSGASLDAWRGSYFVCDQAGPFTGYKCIASFHPTQCFKMFEWSHILRLDMFRAMAEAKSPLWEPPQRTLTIDLSAYDICSRLDSILVNGTKISIDIEGWVDCLTCISVAISPTDSFIIPFTKGNGDNYWDFEDELRIWERLADVLAATHVPKILQNCLYDRFVLQYSYSCVVVNTQDDTMLKSWERYCELEKGLAFLCSIYTREPYYKSDRKIQDSKTHWRYCCKDSAVTYEIADHLTPKLNALSTEHYKFNLDLLNPVLYMELRGIKYNGTLAKERLAEVNTHIYAWQVELDNLAGRGLQGENDKGKILARVRQSICYKRDQDQPKAEWVDSYPKLRDFLLSDAPLTDWWRGYISVTCKWSMNLRSDTFKDYVFNDLGLPKQYKLNKDTGKKELSTDYESLLKIQKESPHRVIEIALVLGALRTRAQMLEIHSDADGRIRCGYNVVGTETGRLTCYTSPTGSGYNLQTIPSDSPTEPEGSPLKKGMRDLFIADPGYYMFQCDLSGADGWTVAAHLAALGDRTMLDDYLAGIKPAKVLCYMLRHGAGSLAGKSRDEIKHLTKPISSKDWDYFFSKIGQHGTSYLMGPQALANQAFKQSEGKLVVSKKDTEDLQNLFNIRYRVRLWHNATALKLSKNPVITAASGHSRRFFGRSTDILGQALAHEPQANTTYATNLAAIKLWSDKENRFNDATRLASTMETGRRPSMVSCKLRIEPLHQVHDALLGQFPIPDTAWAVGKIKSYFDNPLIIAGIPITIPFEGNYGTSWGDQSVGSI